MLIKELYGNEISENVEKLFKKKRYWKVVCKNLYKKLEPKLAKTVC